MIINERQRKILEILKNEKSISTKNLMHRLFISESTLRRDLTQMENQGVIHRTHGHAILIESSSLESSIQVRIQTQVKEKGQIALKALDFIHEDESYFVDSSSTVGYLLPFLSNYSNLTVITNGLNNTAILTQTTNARVYLPGGIVYRNTNSILGIETINYIKTFNCNAFIFSCGGVSLDSGITEASLEQSLVKKEMMSHSKVHILLVDHTKFDKVYLCKTTSFENIDYIITNKMPSQGYITAFEKSGTKLIIA